jgi:hypothetical protein
VNLLSERLLDVFGSRRPRRCVTCDGRRCWIGRPGDGWLAGTTRYDLQDDDLSLSVFVCLSCNDNPDRAYAEYVVMVRRLLSSGS